MNKRLGKRVMAGILATILILLTACSNNGNENSAPASSEPPASSSAPPEETASADGPLTKFEPAIEVRIGRTGDGLKFEPGQDIDKNLVSDFYESELGVKIINDWVVNWDQYDSKVNVSISSGSIPDLIQVTGAQMKTLVEADMIEDLTDVFAKYVSEETKKVMTEDGGFAINAATIDGKMYGIPNTIPGYGKSSMIWVRQDWLDQLGLQPPETVEDVVKIAAAFKENNLGGNQGTYGLGLSKDLMKGQHLFGFFNSYHAYPGQWYQDASGKTVYGSVQPEMRAPLLKLAELYKAGLIDREFAVKDDAKMQESIIAGKLGLFYGEFAMGWYLRDFIVNNPEAVLYAYPLPSADETPAKAFLGPTANTFWVVKKGFKHPEVVVKLANFWQEHWFTNPKLEYSTNQQTGIAYYSYAIITFNAVMAAIVESNNIRASIEANLEPDDKTMTANEFGYLRGIYKYKADPLNTKDPEIATGWIYHTTVGTPNSGAEILSHYYKNNLTVGTGLKASSTPTMAEKWATLTKMEEVMITKIIMGEAGIEEFDKFVQDWNKQGGEQITQEVNE
ncbi:extracellular solute-binding protein [Cohnella phaseoli]|uniref:Putative aldouronate transport system substrate-binding protein n=1 Tax=Cohnella phaseoli TaxID=456490 RepID=A0A3D9ITU3_9BACL|nr:extracellular solute-binding protein [Cohnella phaseoli]RED65213.1 putative aldouronate transport system substrate-binding protein [Cohnella phaseoli]